MSDLAGIREKIFLDSDLGEAFYPEEVGERPVPPDMPGVAGIFVGGCIEINGPSRLHRRGKLVLAHAHIGGDDHLGWICYQNPRRYANPRYEWLRWHEYAHILSNDGHGERWRHRMRQLGQPIPARYAYRPRTGE